MLPVVSLENFATQRTIGSKIHFWTKSCDKSSFKKRKLSRLLESDVFYKWANVQVAVLSSFRIYTFCKKAHNWVEPYISESEFRKLLKTIKEKKFNIFVCHLGSAATVIISLNRNMIISVKHHPKSKPSEVHIPRYVTKIVFAQCRKNIFCRV